jgi:tripartite-type tricarboxylate transporter receptor subunit TctC
MKHWKTLLAALALPLATAGFSAQAAYPEQPIRIVVPYSAGGSSDVIARAISDELGKELGQPVIVDNRAGAGSMIGTAYVANEAPDGYTLLIADVPFTIVPALYRERAKYRAEKDFAPISLLGLAPAYLFVTPSSPIKTAGDLVKAAKAQPGSISIGSGGNGSLTHLMAELFMINTKSQLVHVPYKGASASVTDLAAGQIQTSFTTMASANALYQAGRLRPIAVSSPQRQKDTPDVPTFQESGIPNMTAESWWGLVAPAGVSKPVRDRLSQAMAKVMQSTRVKARMSAVGVNVPADTGAPALQKLIKADLARWQDVVQRANIKLE